MSTHSPLAALLATALLLPLASAADCYFPNGTIATDYNWAPCSSGSGFSACCIPDEGDICQPDGLCYYTPNNHVFRGACTDPTFQDPACPKICTSGDAFDTWVWVQKCLGTADDGNYKCGGLANDGHQWATCATPDPSWSLQTQTTSGSAATKTTKVTTTTTTPKTTATQKSATTGSATRRTTTGTATATTDTATDTATGTDTGTGTPAAATDTGTSVPIIAPDAKSGLGTGAIVGIVIGAVAAIAIAAAGIWFCLRSKRNAAAAAAAAATAGAAGAGATSQPGQPDGSAPPAGGYYAPGAAEKVAGAPGAVELGAGTTAYADQTYKAYPGGQPAVSELSSPGFVPQQYAPGTAPNELPSQGFVPGYGQQFAAELDGSGVQR